MLGVLEDEAVLGLGVAQLVEVDLLVLVPGGELLARFGGVVATVVEAVAAPGRAGELDPLQVVRQLAAAGHAHDLQLAPVGARRRVADHDVAVVLGETGQTGPRGAVLRERVGIEEDLGLAGQALLVVGHALVLEAVVLAEKVVIARPERRAVAGVVHQRLQPSADGVAVGDLAQVAEGEGVLLLHPGGHGRGLVILEPAVRVGHLGAVVVVRLVHRGRLGILERRRIRRPDAQDAGGRQDRRQQDADGHVAHVASSVEIRFAGPDRPRGYRSTYLNARRRPGARAAARVRRFSPSPPACR